MALSIGMRRALLRPRSFVREDSVQFFEVRKVLVTNLRLLGMDAVAFDGKLYLAPNCRTASRVVLYFLFRKLDSRAASDRFRDCWPMVEPKKQESVFRRVCLDWLKELPQDAVPVPPNIAGLLLSPVCIRFYTLCLHLSSFVLQKESRPGLNLPARFTPELAATFYVRRLLAVQEKRLEHHQTWKTQMSAAREKQEWLEAAKKDKKENIARLCARRKDLLRDAGVQDVAEELRLLQDKWRQVEQLGAAAADQVTMLDVFASGDPKRQLDAGKLLADAPQPLSQTPETSGRLQRLVVAFNRSLSTMRPSLEGEAEFRPEDDRGEPERLEEVEATPRSDFAKELRLLTEAVGALACEGRERFRDQPLPEDMLLRFTTAADPEDQLQATPTEVLSPLEAAHPGSDFEDHLRGFLETQPATSAQAEEVKRSCLPSADETLLRVLLWPEVPGAQGEIGLDTLLHIRRQIDQILSRAQVPGSTELKS